MHPVPSARSMALNGHRTFNLNIDCIQTCGISMLDRGWFVTTTFGRVPCVGCVSHASYEDRSLSRLSMRTSNEHGSLNALLHCFVDGRGWVWGFVLCCRKQTKLGKNQTGTEVACTKNKHRPLESMSELITGKKRKHPKDQHPKKKQECFPEK